MAKKTVSVSPGDVFQVPLPDGRFAYGRVYEDASIGIYGETTAAPLRPPIGSREFLFIVAIYSDILESGYWPIIGQDPFEKDECSWPPPYFIRDVVSGDYEIYHKGVIEPATPKEIEGLEEAVVYEADHILERIVVELDKAVN